jgi:hypothetical protein
MAGILQKGARRFVTQIGAAGVPDAVTTLIPLVQVGGLPTDTEIEIVIDRSDSSGNLTPLKEEVVRGTLSGNSLINCTRGVEGTAQVHSAGAVVNSLLTASMWNEAIQYVKDLTSMIYPIGAIYTHTINTNPSTFLGGTWVAFGTGRTIFGVDGGQSEFDAPEETGGSMFHNHTIVGHTHTIQGHTHVVPTIAHTHDVTTSNHSHIVNGNTSSAQGGFGAYSSGSLSPDGNHTHNVNITSSANGGQTISSTSSLGQNVTSQGSGVQTSDSSGTLTSSFSSLLPPYITVYMFKRIA